ncbi:MAG: hypothetical protein ABSH09_30400 [Bryobacteraceae bacterium]|jgi:hypothetical protein
MYHYDPVTALEELQEEALLPNPVHVRDMMARGHLTPEQAVEMGRRFQDYLHAFSDAQAVAKSILEILSGNTAAR